MSLKCLYTTIKQETGADPNVAGTVTYRYLLPGKPGAIAKTTIWLQEGEYATDVFVKGLDYRVGSNLYVDADTIKLTTKPQGKVMGVVTKSPSEGNPFMNFYLKQYPYNQEQS